MFLTLSTVNINYFRKQVSKQYYLYWRCCFFLWSTKSVLEHHLLNCRAASNAWKWYNFCLFERMKRQFLNSCHKDSAPINISSLFSDFRTLCRDQLTYIFKNVYGCKYKLLNFRSFYLMVDILRQCHFEDLDNGYKGGKTAPLCNFPHKTQKLKYRA
jgi:hypothetical protein